MKISSLPVLYSTDHHAGHIHKLIQLAYLLAAYPEKGGQTKYNLYRKLNIYYGEILLFKIRIFLSMNSPTYKDIYIYIFF